MGVFLWGGLAAGFFCLISSLRRSWGSVGIAVLYLPTIVVLVLYWQLLLVGRILGDSL